MPQGDFTKEECDFVRVMSNSIYGALSEPMKAVFANNYKAINTFLDAARTAAPERDTTSFTKNAPVDEPPNKDA